MIFLQYEVDENGNFHRDCRTPLPRLTKNCLEFAEKFLEDNANNFFPIVRIDSLDNLDCNVEQTLRLMFLYKQVEFFLAKGWTVALMNRDNDNNALFICDPSEVRLQVMCISSVLAVSGVKFRVSGFFPQCLIVDLGNCLTHSDVCVI